jgi:hypothetical protein
MKEYQSLTHTRWDCKYHVVFIPKNRKKRTFGVLRLHLGAIFRRLGLLTVLSAPLRGSPNKPPASPEVI